MSNMLVVYELAKSFKDKDVFSEITYTFEGGHIYGLIGPNGCGKTVFMKCLCGLMPADHGSVRFNDQNTEPPKGTFGVIIETPGFLPNYSGYTNLKMLAELRRKILKNELSSLLDQVGLLHVAKKKVSKYSLGMRQRLGIAQAIMDDPPILLLDEPFNALDHDSLQSTYELLISLRNAGKIIILASHHKQDIDHLCDVIFQFSAGKLCEQTCQPTEN